MPRCEGNRNLPTAASAVSAAAVRAPTASAIAWLTSVDRFFWGEWGQLSGFYFRELGQGKNLIFFLSLSLFFTRDRLCRRPTKEKSHRASLSVSIDLSSTEIRHRRQYKRTFGDEEGGSGSGGGDTGDNGSKGRRRGAVPVVLVAFLYSVTALAFTVYIITTFVLEHRCKSAQRAARENPQLVAPGSAAATAAAAAAAKARTAALLADSCSRGSEAAKWGLMAAFMLSNLAFCIAVIYMHRRRTQRQKERQLQRQREGLEVADAAAAATAPATAATTTTNAEATTTTNAEATPATPPTDHDMAKAAA